MTPRGILLASASGLLLLLTSVAGPSRAATLNIDVDPRETAHVGADGVLSTGGTFWNVIDVSFSADRHLFDVDDEFGNATGIDVTLDADGSIDANARAIELYRGGATGILDLKNLLGLLRYDLAVYTTNPGLSVQVTHAGGTSAAATGGTFDIELPGDEGEEYVLFEDLAPFDLGDGVIGLRIATLGETRMAGIQLVTAPEPATHWMLGLGLLAAAFRRRRR